MLEWYKFKASCGDDEARIMIERMLEIKRFLLEKERIFTIKDSKNIKRVKIIINKEDIKITWFYPEAGETRKQIIFKSFEEEVNNLCLKICHPDLKVIISKKGETLSEIRRLLNATSKRFY